MKTIAAIALPAAIAAAAVAIPFLGDAHRRPAATLAADPAPISVLEHVQTPIGAAVLGKVVDSGESETLDTTKVGSNDHLTGERMYWLSQAPGAPGQIALNWGVTDQTSGETVPYEGSNLGSLSELESTGIHGYTEVDNGDAVAVIAGTGTASSNSSGPLTLLPFSFGNLRLAIIVHNNGSASTITYSPSVQESVSPSYVSSTVRIP